MPGLFGMLEVGSRALQAQQQGVAVAGQNLANVNNPAYARQRLTLQTSAPILTGLGPVGTGVDAVAITQLRDALLDGQIRGETSVMGFLQSQQTALQYATAGLGEKLTGSASTGGTSSVGSSGGLADDLTGLFNAFQGLTTAPASLTNRQVVISQAQQLASQFNQVDQRLAAVNGQLNQSVQTDVSSANQLLSGIAGLNQQITASEAASGGTANDLRDLRQQKIEQLAKLLNFQTATTPDGAVNLSVDGNLLVAGNNLEDTLQAYDAGGGQLLVRTANSGTPLALTGGSIQGTITARDGALQSLRTGLNNLATQLISQVNTVYRAGYDLNGNTNADFFTGTNAANIGVNATLVGDPSQLQASGVLGAPGDSQIALALAQPAGAKQAGLGNQTFSESYTGVITDLGFSLAAVNSQQSDQQVVQNMLQAQRSSVSGVSLDEEMVDLVKYQRAFQASAHLVSTIDQMLDVVMNLKR
jgi:flagellar hook-associated protein 1 FlgK